MTIYDKSTEKKLDKNKNNSLLFKIAIDNK